MNDHDQHSSNLLQCCVSSAWDRFPSPLLPPDTQPPPKARQLCHIPPQGTSGHHMAPPTHLGGQDQTTLPMHQPSPSAHQMKQNIETISILVQARPGIPPHIPASARTSPPPTPQSQPSLRGHFSLATPIHPQGQDTGPKQKRHST